MQFTYHNYKLGSLFYGDSRILRIFKEKNTAFWIICDQYENNILADKYVGYIWSAIELVSVNIDK